MWAGGGLSWWGWAVCAGSILIYRVLVACGGSVRSGLWHRLNAEWYSYRHEVNVVVDGARMGVACVWMARMWATRVGGAGVGAIALGSARGWASEGAQMHASGCGMGLVVRVPLDLSCWASEAR